MFRDASRRKFDVLPFESLDRLSREGALETLQHLNRLTGYGVQWRSLTDQYLDSTGMFRDAVISILAVVAKQERVRLSERTKAGLERARKQGKVLGRPKSPVDASEIQALRASGLSWGAIGWHTGLARATCQKACGQCQTQGNERQSRFINSYSAHRSLLQRNHFDVPNTTTTQVLWWVRLY